MTAVKLRRAQRDHPAILSRYLIEVDGETIGYVTKQRHRQQYRYHGRHVSHHTCWSIDGMISEGCYDTRQQALASLPAPLDKGGMIES
jgi:hypothetical protein